MVRTFQLTRVLAKMTVLENVLLAAPAQPGERLDTALFRPRRWRRREAEVREEAMEMLGEVGIHTHAEEYAATLSGGQRKLLELARALMTRPTARAARRADGRRQSRPSATACSTTCRRLREERGLTVLFVEHDMDVVMGVSEEVIVMARGHASSPTGRPSRSAPTPP